MNNLPLEDSRYLDAAEGWLGLGDLLAARAELDEIAADWRGHPDVLAVRYRIFEKERRWENCLELATTIVQLAPESSFGWIHRSFALHELKRTQEALEELLPAVTIFPNDITIRYNLACYECVLGNLPLAKMRLTETLVMAEKLKRFDECRAEMLEDPDLKPLWQIIKQARC